MPRARGISECRAGPPWRPAPPGGRERIRGGPEGQLLWRRGGPAPRGPLRGRILPGARGPPDRREILLRHRGGDERTGHDDRGHEPPGSDDPRVRAGDGIGDESWSRRRRPSRPDARVRPQADEVRCRDVHPHRVLAIGAGLRHRHRDEPRRIVDAARGSARGSGRDPDDCRPEGPASGWNLARRERDGTRRRALPPPRAGLAQRTIPGATRSRRAAATERLRPHASGAGGVGLCVHFGGGGTVSSTIMALSNADPGENVLLYADGSPCTTPYRDYHEVIRRLPPPD